jgi:hypothetical protein
VAAQSILVVCLVAVFCLTPLALYLFRLALVTRRDHPTVISGQWDFVALVAGLSGFILFGGGLVLSLLQSNMRYWMRGNFESLRSAWGQDKVTWIILASIYVLLVIGIVGLTLASRRRSLVVYNVDPAAFEVTVLEVFEQLGRPIERRGNLWIGAEPLFELEPFAGGHTVTLRWVSDDRLLFQEVDRLLREALRNVLTDENATTRWLMAIAGGLGFWAVCCFGLLLFYVVSLRH